MKRRELRWISGGSAGTLSEDVMFELGYKQGEGAEHIKHQEELWR